MTDAARIPTSDSAITDFLAALRGVPAIGILRGCPPRWAGPVVDAAAEAGFRMVEVTLDSPEPYRSIAFISAMSADVVVGAGTVRSVEEVRLAIAAGARFLVSPVIALPVIEEALYHDVPILPGAATPTEILLALEAGVLAVKVFPAGHLGGPSYIGAIGAPLGHPLLIPTGGVSANNAGAYLKAGAFAVAVGGSVFARDALETGDVERVRREARLLVEAVA